MGVNGETDQYEINTNMKLIDTKDISFNWLHLHMCVWFDISALFTSIPVPRALDVINCLFTEHIEVPEARGKYNCSFEENTVGLHKNEVMSLLN